MIGHGGAKTGEDGERVLFVHDLHALIGEREFDFEDAVRDTYASAIADDDTRFLWYLTSTHGSGDAYHVVTVTAVRDGAAWERLGRRLRYGDLAEWSTEVEAMRYGCTSTLLVSTEWSPLVGLDLGDVPTEPSERPVALYREDTYEGPGVEVAVGRPVVAPDSGDALTCIAAFRPALAPSGMLRVLSRVADADTWLPSFAADTGWDDWSGSVLPTLPDGVERTSRILRSTPWAVTDWA